MLLLGSGRDPSGGLWRCAAVMKILVIYYTGNRLMILQLARKPWCAQACIKVGHG